LFLSPWLAKIKSKNFSKISLKFLEKILVIIGAIFLFIIFYLFFQIYVPINPTSSEIVNFTVEKGWSNEKVAIELKEAGIIRSSYFFKLYCVLSLKHLTLQAGQYKLSPAMSIHKIANIIAQGRAEKNKLVILEGWKTKDIAKYLESKGLCSQNYFLTLIEKNYYKKFSFLEDKPQDLNLEGYLFPDTYEINNKDKACEDILEEMLKNFDRKLTPELRLEIKNQKKTIFEVITIASIIEKEASSLEDKKIVSDIFWKRLANGMPLQSCATINYITGKNEPAALIRDTKIDSPYNTYKYAGLPKGPISNPGMDSILAAIYPQKTDYWYFLADGKMIFSRTLEEHNAAKARYLKSR